MGPQRWVHVDASETGGWRVSATPSGVPRWRRFAMWLAHAQPVIVALGFTLIVLSSRVSHGAGIASFTVAIITVWSTSIAEAFHSSSLCPRCLRDERVDGAESLPRRRHWLRLHHISTRGRWVLAANLVPWLLILLRTPDWAAFAPLWLWWSVTSYASLRHRPLELWCPRCRGWWGHGGGDATPVTPPVPVGTRVR